MTPWTDALVARASNELRVRADSVAAGPMAAYMKTPDPFYGVKAPVRAEVFKILVGEFKPADFAAYEAAVLALFAAPQREMRYLAIDYAQKFKKYITSDALGLYEHLIRVGSWWDLVDGPATHLVGGVLAGERDVVTPLMRAWIDDDDMWIRRTAIICQNRHGKKTDATMLFEFCLARMHEKEFFIRKAIGWALREYSSVDPDAVRAFLFEHEGALSGLSFREGAKRLRRDGFME